MPITYTTVLPPVLGAGKCPKSKDSYKSINNKSASNRKKHSIIRMMKRRKWWLEGIRFDAAILSTPVPDYINKIMNNKLRMPIVSEQIIQFRRYSDESSKHSSG